jgi:hypothetical protein
MEAKSGFVNLSQQHLQRRELGSQTPYIPTIFLGLLKGEAQKLYLDVSEPIRYNWSQLTNVFLRTFREVGGEARALGRLSKLSMKST